MKSRSTLSSLGNYQPEPTTLEITETEISGIYNRHQRKYPYPRHIAQVESPSHRGDKITVSQISVLPKSCNLKPCQGISQVNEAVDILQYQLSDRISQQKHLDNMRRSLQRRLQAAEVSGNKKLIDLLNDEFKQFKTSV
jgi:hypothetical protein